MPKRPKKLSDQVRELVMNSGLSRYAICKATGLDNGAMSNFLAGRRGLSLDSLDALAEFLDWELKPRKNR
jgi:transcriptional regulator with XRE-family HTH domain